MGRKQSPFIGRRVSLVEAGVPVLYPRYSCVEDILLDGAGKKRPAPEPDTPAVKGTAEQPAAKKSRKDNQQAAAAEQEEQQPKQNGAAASEQPVLSKQDKKRLKQQQQQEQPAAAVVEAPAADADADASAAAEQQLTKREKRKLRRQHLQAAANGGQPTLAEAAPSAAAESKGNAEEAAHIRQVLGFTDANASSSAAAQPAAAPAAAAAAAKPPAAAAAAAGSGMGFTFNFSSLLSGAAAAAPTTTEEAVAADTEAKLAAITAVDTADKDGCIPRRVYVGGMPYSYSREQVEEYWGWCGEVEGLDLLTFPDTGRFRGIAFITFKTQEGADAALACNGEQVDGQTLKVERCKATAVAKSIKASGRSNNNQHQQQSQRGAGGGFQQQQQSTAAAAAGGGVGSGDSNSGPGKTPGYNVAYVGNIAFEARPEDISALFEACSVTKVRLHTDKDTRKSKGYAHVHFADEEGLEKAIAMTGTQLMGRGVKVSYGQPKKS